jgi:hypothetical protein
MVSKNQLFVPGKNIMAKSNIYIYSMCVCVCVCKACEIVAGRFNNNACHSPGGRFYIMIVVTDSDRVNHFHPDQIFSRKADI